MSGGASPSSEYIHALCPGSASWCSAQQPKPRGSSSASLRSGHRHLKAVRPCESSGARNRRFRMRVAIVLCHLWRRCSRRSRSRVARAAACLRLLLLFGFVLAFLIGGGGSSSSSSAMQDGHGGDDIFFLPAWSSERGLGSSSSSSAMQDGHGGDDILFLPAWSSQRGLGSSSSSSAMQDGHGGDDMLFLPAWSFVRGLENCSAGRSMWSSEMGSSRSSMHSRCACIWRNSSDDCRRLFAEKDGDSRWPLCKAWNSSFANSVSCASFFASAGGGSMASDDGREEPWRDGVRLGGTAMGRKAGGVSRAAEVECDRGVFLMLWIDTHGC
jgi:hypothetical protein